MITSVSPQQTAAAARRDHLFQRIEAQLQFAAFLCERQPRNAPAWRALITRAQALIARAAAADEGALTQAVADAERVLHPLAQAAKKHVVHLVGHAHIDMNWMWSWPETVAVTRDTFRTMLALLDEFPQFTFTQSQASVYKICEEYEPELLTRIAPHVRAGRWEVAASHWVETDKNLVSGESLCRHLLYTRAYVHALFGLAPEDMPLDWSPDTFGHAATVPTYLAQGGVKYLYLHRPGGEGGTRAPLFVWRGPDGAQVLVCNHQRFGYNGALDPASMLAVARVFACEAGSRIALCVHGVGDHGGGPTRRSILTALEMMTWPIFPTLRFSTATAFFRAVEKEKLPLEKVTGELNFEFAGCYTSQSLIKRANRLAEARLTDAEAAATLAWRRGGRAYPHALLRAAWHDTLFSHFHDILPGSGVHDTRTYAHGLFQRTMATTSSVESQALAALAAEVATRTETAVDALAMPAHTRRCGHGGGAGAWAAEGALSAAAGAAGDGLRPFFVFNPTAVERNDVCDVTVWSSMSDGAAQPLTARTFHARLVDGTCVPAQQIAAGNFWGHAFVTLAVPVRVPALGYTIVTIEEGSAPADAPAGVRTLGRVHPCSYSRHEREPEGLENELVRVELDMHSGGIAKLLDKRTGVALIDNVAAPALLEYLLERPHSMNSWIIDHGGAQAGMQVLAIDKKLAGPHRASVEVRGRVANSDVVLTYALCAGDPRLHVRVQVTWREIGDKDRGVPALRLTLPLALRTARARYEIPFGALDRPQHAGEEVPALRWASVTGTCGVKAASLLLLNDCKHGHALDGSTLTLSLIRSSYDPDPLPEVREHELRVALLPFAGALPVEAAIQQGVAFNHPLRIISTDAHDGALAPTGAFLAVTPAQVVLSAVKQSEDEKAMLVRLFAPGARAVPAVLTFDKTLCGKVATARAVDALERPCATPTVRVTGNRVRVQVPARGIATVRVTFA